MQKVPALQGLLVGGPERKAWIKYIQPLALANRCMEPN